VKIEPDFGQGGRWRILHIATLLKNHCCTFHLLA
jgi:hypothetical protein